MNKKLSFLFTALILWGMGSNNAPAATVSLLQGTLVNASTQQPMTGMGNEGNTVSATGPSGVVGVNPSFPNFEMYNLSTGSYQLVFNLEGHVITYSFTIAANAPSYMTLNVPVSFQPPTVPVLTAQIASPTSITLNWSASTDIVGIAGYAVARNRVVVSGSANLTGTTWTDTNLSMGSSYSYNVFAIDHDGNSSVSSTVKVTLPAGQAPIITIQPSSQTVTAPAPASFTVVATGNPLPSYQWQLSTNNGSSWAPINGATSATYTTAATTVANNGTQYECVATNSVGSATSNAVTLTVNSATAAFITTNTTTQGNWENAYGADGYYIVSSVSQTPSYASFSLSGGEFYTWESSTTDVRALEIPSGGRVAATYQSSTSFTVDVNMTDGNTHQVALYLLDWDNYGPRNETVQVINPVNNAVLETNNVTSFYTAGKYLVYNISGHVQFVITNNVWGRNAVMSGLFFGNAYQPPIAPNITYQPASTTVIPPTTATFRIAATSLPLPSYQWMIETPGAGTFSAISGATNTSYTTAATTIANSGTQYECVVSNSIVTVTSNPATLTVSGQPVVSIASPAQQSTLTTGSINITAMASENYGAISNVAFYSGTTLLGTVTSNSQTYTYSWTNIPAGTYSFTAVATDSIGRTSSSLPVTITINSVNFTYGVDDNILSKTDARGNTTSYQYDNDNRLLKTSFADNSTVSQAYDLFGNQTSVTDQRGNVLTKTYDAYERLSQTKDPNGGITKFNYDTEGHLLTLTDANNNPTNYTYDPNGRVLTQSNALNLTTTFTYDPNGNVYTRNDANNNTTTYTYDALNHLTNIAYPGGSSVVNVYDALGRKTSMTDSTGSTNYTYDALSRLLTKTAPGSNNKITYTYDSEGNRLTSVDQNNRTITNTFDALNRLYTVTDPLGKTTYGYDADSNKTSIANPNGVTESYTYDPLNRLLTDVNAKGPTVISSFTNVYDIAGMIKTKTLQDGSWTAYSYDALNQLLEETKQTSASIVYDYVYTYDPVGNRLTWTKNTTLGGFWSVDYLNMPSAVLSNMTTAGFGSTALASQPTSLVRSYNYDAGNRLSNWNYAVNIYGSSFPIQTDTYTYDNNGNRLTKQVVLTGQEGTPQQTTYSYDFENRLMSMSLPNASAGSPDTITYTYNGEGLRVQGVLDSVASNYLYDGSNILIERNSSGVTTKTYTRGLDDGGGIGSLINQTASGITQYYDYNDLGSTSDLTTTAGTSADSYSYDAYGNLLTPQASGDTNRYLFSTKEFDARSGLDYFGARYYDSEVGRWLTPDPLGFVDGMNTYVYVNNNPVNLVDPYGLCGQTAPNTSQLIQINVTGLSQEQALNLVIGLTPAGGEEVLSKLAQSSISKIENNINDHLNPSDINGAISDMLGNPVIINGKVYNHLQEVTDALNGLRNGVSNLENEASIEAQNAYNKAVAAIKDVTDKIKGLGI